LAYLLEQSPHEQTIAKQALRAGQPLPDSIANAPVLNMGLQLYIQAFFDLDSERNHGAAPTAIPWSSMAAYADAYDFDAEQREDLFTYVKAMDASHLKRISEKMKVK